MNWCLLWGLLISTIACSWCLPAQSTGSKNDTVFTSVVNKENKTQQAVAQKQKVPSPSHLLSPDRYEFYTFDDDGQLVKKIMSINEIKKIIASNEHSSTESTVIFPFSYYHKISSIPAIQTSQPLGKINPHEPLFSVHDVIESVQKVLNSEIKTKLTPDNKLKDQPTDWKVILPSLLSNSDQNIVKILPANIVNNSTSPKPVTSTTFSPATLRSNATESVTTQSTPNATTVQSTPAETTTKTEVSSTTSKAEVTSTTTSKKTEVTSTTSKTEVSSTTSQPFVLDDAHPALSSPQENIENMLDASKIEIPINQDLAESVSSVLSQIASEISMNSVISFDKTTEDAFSTTSPEELLFTTEYPTKSNGTPIVLNFKLQNKPRPFQKPAQSTDYVITERVNPTTESNDDSTNTTPVEELTTTEQQDDELLDGQESSGSTTITNVIQTTDDEKLLERGGENDGINLQEIISTDNVTNSTDTLQYNVKNTSSLPIIEATTTAPGVIDFSSHNVNSNDTVITEYSNRPILEQSSFKSPPKHNLKVSPNFHSTKLDEDVKTFVELCNELAFSLWSSITHNGISSARSLVLSPFAITSLLAMVFLGARGPTSGQMNEVLKLDDMVSFNPHLVFRNVTESVVISRNPGVATATFVRELYSDMNKGKLLDFYKERALQFYDGYVEEVNFNIIGDIVRRRTNLLIKRQTWGKVGEFLRGSNLAPRAPLAAFSANIFQTDCTLASTEGRDGEIYFIVLPASRLRRLVPVPAAVWKSGFLAGYEPNLDATAVAFSPDNSVVSTIFVLPGQQGVIAPGDSLSRLEQRLLNVPYREKHWSNLLKTLVPRPGLQVQIPRISHRSIVNVTSSLQKMGLKDLFSAEKADLRGLNGLSNDLHLSDMIQINMFSTCGEDESDGSHHTEIYPASPYLRKEKSSDPLFENLFAVSDFENPIISSMPLALRPRQARIPEVMMAEDRSKADADTSRLKFDRPFLFFVRHNPTGLILHMGRFNPRLLP